MSKKQKMEPTADSTLLGGIGFEKNGDQLAELDNNTESADKLKPIQSVSSGPEPSQSSAAVAENQTEIGGREGPDPTRYGDWERNGRCIDF